ncbi:MAG: protease pro-enzyme activation domain-containing protein [Acidimicrobiales bacterium]
MGLSRRAVAVARRRVFRLAVGAVSAALLAVGTPAVGVLSNAAPASAATSGASLVVKIANRPAVPAGAFLLGRVAPSSEIVGDVALRPRDAAGLTAYATAVSTPGSSLYHDYLTAAGFDARFAPSPSTIAAVEAQLRAGGLRITSLSRDGLLVGFKGSATRAEDTFHTTIERYRLSSGRTVFANSSAVALEGAIAPSVEAVVGLNNLLVPTAGPIARASAAIATATKVKTRAFVAPVGSANACATAASTATADNGLTATDVAHAYGLDPLYSAKNFGQGQTIAVLDLYGYSSSDLANFDNCYFGKSEGAQVLANDSYTSIDNGAQPGNGTGGSAETELDVETVNAYAPQAKVDVYEAPATNSGFLDDIAAMTASSAKIETISYGQCEQTAQVDLPGYIQEENYLFEEAAAIGKTVFASSGDSGNDICSAGSGAPAQPVLSASDPASQPFVTGVGGTSMTAATIPPTETVWNDGGAGGAGGGGLSSIWPEPAWQASAKVRGLNNPGVISAADAVDGGNFCQATYGPSTNCREVPDVSAEASPNIGGFPVYLDGAWNQYGGTSLASPTWAAITADIDSTPSCVAEGGVGFVSPKLYAISSVAQEYAASFNDITLGNNDNFAIAGGLYPATVGYDMASGLGTPRVTGANGARGLAYYLCAAPAVSPPTVTSIAPPAVAVSPSGIATGTTLAIDGSGYFSGAQSDVVGVSVGGVSLPSSDWNVESNTAISVTLPTALAASEIGNGGAGDGSGTYVVTVTLTGGATSAPSAASNLVLYDSGTGTSGSTPVVAGTYPSAGGDAGGSPVTIYGSGFAEGTVSSVTFGGTPAASFTVTSDNTIRAVTPALGASPTSCVAGDNVATGVCQVEVQVTLSDGTSSSEGTIPLEYSGAAPSPTSTTFTPGLSAAPTEFDYEPAPTISSITYVNGPNQASEAGGTQVEIQGTGLGALGLEWVNVGSYLNSGSEAVPSFYSSTELLVSLPGQTATKTPLTEPVTVQTYGSPNSASGETLGAMPPSNSLSVTYAPTPTVSKVTGGVAKGGGVLAGPVSGGSPLVLTGSGFDYAEAVVFVDQRYGFPTAQYAIDVVSNSKIELLTPATLTGVYTIEVCNPSGCSGPSATAFTFYLPGNPSLSSDTPTSGKAGTKVTLAGYNLGYVEAVYFGSVKAKAFSQSSVFESGTNYGLTVTAPAGVAGKRVDIRVVTAESLATGFGLSPVNPGVTFTYARAKKKR